MQLIYNIWTGISDSVYGRCPVTALFISAGFLIAGDNYPCGQFQFEIISDKM